MSTSADMFEGPVSLLRELRDRDSETGLLTASRLYRALLSEIARSARYGNPLSCVLVEVRGLDKKEREARLQLANRLAVVMRNTDHAGLWDHDVFLLALPETDEPGVQSFTEKTREELDDLTSGLKAAGSGNVSIDIRATTWKAGDDAAAMLRRLETRTSV